MQKINFIKNELLAQNVLMDGSVNFQANGDIHFLPCPWEDGKQVTPHGARVRYQGGISVDGDGHTHVKRYFRGTKGPKYETLYETEHGEVKMTRPLWRKDASHPNGYRRLTEERVYVTFKFPKKYLASTMAWFFRQEAEKIEAFLRTRMTSTQWTEKVKEG